MPLEFLAIGVHRGVQASEFIDGHLPVQQIDAVDPNSSLTEGQCDAPCANS